MTKFEKDTISTLLKMVFEKTKESIDDVGMDMDPRCRAIAVTHLQTAQMWAVRGIYEKENNQKETSNE